MLQKITESKYINFYIDLVFILIAIAISIYAREAFVYYSSAFSYYFFDGNRLLTTNDAYHFATATKDLIQGNLNDAFYPIASLEMLSILSTALYYVLPFSIDELFFFLPIILSSLVVIPVYLFAKELSNRYFALFVAVLTPLSIGYSNRTIGGYYDTDMLVLFFPLFGVYFMYRILKQYNLRDLIFASICFMLALAWHKVSATYILTASIFFAFCYILLKDRQNMKNYEALGVLIISISFINIYIKLILLAILLHFMRDRVFVFDGITKKIVSKLKYKSLIILSIGCIVFVISNIDLITSRLATYVTDKMITSSAITLHSTSGTIMELAPLKLSNLAERTMGDNVTFIFGAIGAIVMFINLPRTIILLPFLLLSIASLKLGLRFSMFGAPVFALGYFYFLYFLLGFLNKTLKDKFALSGVKFIITISMALFAILPNYYHTKNYFIPPVVYGFEINALDSIKKDSTNRDDVTISWWDYGFLIPYYSNTKVIVQGTDLDGVNHFISSFILSSTSQLASYNMSKLITEALYTSDKELIKYHNIDRILYKYNAQNNPESFMQSLSYSSFLAPKIDKNIYLYIPFSILDIQTAIDEFSDIDYKSGKVLHKEESKTLAKYSLIEDKGDHYVLDEKFEFYPKSGIFKSLESKKSIKVQKFHIIDRNSGKLEITSTIYDDDKTKLHMIYSKELKMFFAIDDRTNSSLSVQLFLYENYDKDLFSLLDNGKWAKAYKLK